jgi:hypothetical protein
MVMKTQSRKRASICGWIGCAIGCLAIVCKIACYYVLGTVGYSPGTTIYVIRILDADILAFVAGIPLGICAWYYGRKGLGMVAVILCVVSLAMTLVRLLL